MSEIKKLFKILKKEVSKAEMASLKRDYVITIYSLINLKATAQDLIDIYDKRIYK